MVNVTGFMMIVSSMELPESKVVNERARPFQTCVVFVKNGTAYPALAGLRPPVSLLFGQE